MSPVQRCSGAET